MRIFVLWLLSLITLLFCVGTYFVPSDKVFLFAVVTSCFAMVTLVYGTYLQHRH